MMLFSEQGGVAGHMKNLMKHETSDDFPRSLVTVGPPHITE